MKMDWIGRGMLVALSLSMLAPLAASATSEARANASEVAREKAKGLALGFRDAPATVPEPREKGKGPVLGFHDAPAAPASVPEPSAALIFAGGLLVAGATRRLGAR